MQKARKSLNTLYTHGPQAAQKCRLWTTRPGLSSPMHREEKSPEADPSKRLHAKTLVEPV